jgi:hypothetical protein
MPGLSVGGRLVEEVGAIHGELGVAKRSQIQRERAGAIR